MSEVLSEMLAFQWGAFLGFAAGMTGVGFMWWMSKKGKR